MARDLGIGVEAQRIGTDEKSIGAFEVARFDRAVGDLFQLRPDDVD
jgi:hypothetical protein